MGPSGQERGGGGEEKQRGRREAEGEKRSRGGEEKDQDRGECLDCFFRPVTGFNGRASSGRVALSGLICLG